MSVAPRASATSFVVTPRAVFDTNAFVSAYAFGGKPAGLMRAAITGDIVLVTSPALLAELARVLADKLAFDAAHGEQVVAQIARVAEIVRPKVRIGLIGDEADNRVLECAREGGAEWIVSGDSHLLELGEFEGIAVLSVADAAARMVS